MCTKKNKATVTATLAAGSTASPYFAQVNISKRLCKKTCADETPVFAPQFSFVSIATVGTNQYMATIHVEGTITYNPCNTNGCCAKVESISQNFTVPIAATTAPTTVTVTAGTSVNAMQPNGCQNCTRNFVSETPITITVA